MNISSPARLGSTHYSDRPCPIVQSFRARLLLFISFLTVAASAQTPPYPYTVTVHNNGDSASTSSGSVSVPFNPPSPGTAAVESGSINGNSITMSSSGDLFTGAQLLVGATLSGTLIMNYNGMGPSGNSNTVISAASNNFIVNTGLISGVGALSAYIANSGTIDANLSGGGGQLILSMPPGPPQTNGQTSTNSGTMQASSGGTLVITGSATGLNFAPPQLDNTGGTIQALAGSTVQLNVSTTGGTLSTAGNGILQEGVNLTNVTNTGVVTATGGSLYTSFVNNGSLNLQGQLGLGNNVSLTGTGAVTLGTASAPYSISGGSNTLTIGYGETIQGVGTVAANVVNNGLINANVSGQTLSVVAPTSVVNANTTAIPDSPSGVLQAQNGGTLVLTGGAQGASYTNTGGTIQALDLSTVALNNISVTGGTLYSGGSGVIDINGGALTTLTNQAELYAGPGGGSTLNGTITNNGQIELAGTNTTGGAAILSINGAVTLSGTGSVTMDNHLNPGPANSIQGVAFTGATLTNDTNHILQGAGSISGLTLINNGFVYANASGGTLGISGPITNNNLMYAQNGGTMAFDNATVTNGAAGLIEAQAGSTVSFVNSSVTGGTISSLGSGGIQINGGVTLTSLTNDGTITAGYNSGNTLSGTITNNGQIQFNNTNQVLEINGAVTLTGTGSVTMTPGVGSFGNGTTIEGVTGSAILTNGAQQTIQGAGVIAGLTLVNNGSVLANANGGTLNVSGTINNNNQMTATNGGTMAFDNATVTNGSAGVLAAQTGSTITLLSSSVAGGTLSTTGTGDIQINGVTLSNLTNNGTITAAYNSGNVLSGTIVNNGQIQFNDTNQLLSINGDVALTGTGSVTMTPGVGSFGNGTTIEGVTGSAILTNGAQQTIQGAGVIAGLTLVNNGSVLANANGGTLNVSGTINNNNQMTATNGGTMAFDNATVTNGAAGVLAAQTGSTITLLSSSVTGGTLSTTGTGDFQINGVTLSNLTNNGAITAVYNSVNALSGTIVNNGQISFNNTNQILEIVGAVTLSGTGSVTMTPGTGSFGNGTTIEGVTSGASLTNDTQHTIQGAGIVFGLTTVANKGTIDANASGGTLLLAANTTNTGTLAASNGGTLHLNANLSNFSGTTLTGGTYVVNGQSGATSTLQLDSLGNSASGEIVNNAAKIVLNGPTANTLLTDAGGNNALAPLANNLAAGSLTVTGGYTFSTVGNFSNAGGIDVGGNGSILNIGSNGTGTYTQTGGTTLIEFGGTLNAATVNLSGGLMQIDGTLDPAQIDNTITLSGTGDIVGDLTNHGLVILGDSTSLPGTLSETGNFVQGIDGTLFESIDLSASGLFSITGNVTLGGTLDIGLLGGFNPTPTELFDLINFTGTETGAFSSITGADAGDWTLVYNANRVELEYTPPAENGPPPSAAPEPSTYGLCAVLAILAVVARRPMRQILTQVGASIATA